MSRVDGDPSAFHRRGEAADGLTLPYRGPTRTGADRAETPEGLDARGPDDAVDRQSDVLLEVANGAVGARSEDPVLAPRVEPQEPQHGLECPDVVAPVVGEAQVEDPMAQLEAGLDELFPRLLPDHAVDQQVPALLELTNGPFGGGPELRVLVGIDGESQCDQSRLDVGHGVAAGAAGDDADG